MLGYYLLIKKQIYTIKRALNFVNKWLIKYN